MTWSLEHYRPLLRLQARSLHLSARMRRRFDESDLVNETLLRAHAGIGGFQGKTEAELIAWLQTALGNVLTDQIRRHRADKRDVYSEAVLACVAESSAQLGAFLPAKVDSPSAALRREELIVRIAAAVDRLDPDQRDAIIMRDMQELPLKEIAERMGKTEKSVSGLLFRGRQRLRELLADCRDEGVV